MSIQREAHGELPESFLRVYSGTCEALHRPCMSLTLGELGNWRKLTTSLIDPVVGVKSLISSAYAADEPIDPTAYRPQKVRVEPPVLPSDLPDQLKRAFGRSVDDRFPYVADDPLGAKCPVRRSAHVRQRHQSCGPLQCSLDGGGIRGRTDRRK